MEPPPVRYVTTADGFDIAYTVTGSGRPFVFMPWPFSNVSLIWGTRFGPALLEGLAARYRLIQYNSRGQGMSTRGLPEYHVMDDHLLDLEAVVERLSLDRFVLCGAPLFGHVAVRYAIQHPERVEALILSNVMIDTAFYWDTLYEDLARRDWELFLHTIASSFSLQGAPVELPYWRQSFNQDDYLKIIRAASGSSIRNVLPSVEAPTLIMNTRRMTEDAPVSRLADDGQMVAALIPNARLILFDGYASYWYSAGPEPPPAVLAIEDFVSSLGLREVSAGPGSRGDVLSTRPASPLSAREFEVLRLVSEGKTNRQIAEELVISERTVINHLSHIFIKTGAENRAGATAYAFRHGLA